MRFDCGILTETFMRRTTLARHTAALLSLSTLLAPAVGAHASPVPEWLGALGGLAAGAGLERLARRGRPPTA